MQYFTDLPIALVLVHMLGAVLITAFTARLIWSVRGPASELPLDSAAARRRQTARHVPGAASRPDVGAGQRPCVGTGMSALLVGCDRADVGSAVEVPPSAARATVPRTRRWSADPA